MMQKTPFFIDDLVEDSDGSRSRRFVGMGDLVLNNTCKAWRSLIRLLSRQRFSVRSCGHLLWNQSIDSIEHRLRGRGREEKGRQRFAHWASSETWGSPVTWGSAMGETLSSFLFSSPPPHPLLYTINILSFKRNQSIYETETRLSCTSSAKMCNKSTAVWQKWLQNEIPLCLCNSKWLNVCVCVCLQQCCWSDQRRGRHHNAACSLTPRAVASKRR